MSERSRGGRDQAPGKGGKVKWDTSDLRTTYADACNVSLTRDEVAILFGTTPARQADVQEMTGHVSNCIILNPLSAKRTVKLLGDFLREYESRYGAVGSGSSPGRPPGVSRPGSVRSGGSPPGRSASDGSSLPVWGDADEPVLKMVELVRGLGVEVGFERSFKMSRQNLLDRRFLMTINKGALGPEAQEILCSSCRELGMPHQFMDTYAAKLSQAGYCHFGFEAGAESSIYKAYLEFWSDWEQEITSRPERSEPFLLHLGFKWDTSNPDRKAMTQYLCHPRLSVDKMVHSVSDIYGSTGGAAFETTSSVIKMAASRVDPGNILYLEATEEGNPRRSFDVNIYRSDMNMELFYPLLLEMCRHYDIADQKFQAVFELCRNKTLGHISGGIDREGNDFFTVYYGMESY